MKKVRLCQLFVAFLLLSFQTIIAQKLNYFTGSPIANYDNENFKIIGVDATYLYSFHGNANGYFLNTFDKDSLKVISTIRIPLPPRDSIKYYLRNYFVKSDTITILYSSFERFGTVEKLGMISFNKDGKRYGEPKLIEISSGWASIKDSRFYIKENKDKTELISYSFGLEKDTIRFRVDHFNYSGTTTKSENFTFDKSSATYSFMHVDISNNVYDISRDRRRKRNVNWKLQVYAANFDSIISIDLRLPSEKNVLLFNTFNLFYDTDETVLIVTPYSLDRQDYLGKGLYILRMNMNTHELINEKVVPFQTFNDANQKSSEFSLQSCILFDCLPLENKSKRFLFESRLETINNIYGIPIGNEYDMGNIFTVDVDSMLNVIEIHKIKKQQHTNTKGFMFAGFSTICNKNDSYFIYNELAENIGRTPEEMKIQKSRKLDESIVISTKLGEGRVVRKTLIDKKDSKGIDAVIPWSSFLNKADNTLYLVRKIDESFFMTKIFFKE